jgi:S-formylglutathione hydrolase FrmB
MLTLPRSLSLTKWLTRPVIAVLVGLALMVPPAKAQLLDTLGLDLVNLRIEGRVIGYTRNHGGDYRIYSPILGMRRDLYVYLPPGYDPHRSYSLVVFLHMASLDEQYFVRSNLPRTLDALILSGAVPPIVVAAPDGIFGDPGPFHKHHSLFINSKNGRFEDHIIQEVVPFLMAHYSIRPEREAHGLMGISAGGYGAQSLAMGHADYFAAVATMGGALNLRYYNVDQVYFEDFDPATYRAKGWYDPDEVIGKFYCGLMRLPAKRFMGPVFGDGDIVPELAQTNPADRLFSSGLQPGQLAIYANYGGRDNFNFDAQVESFAWLAASKGIEVTLDRDPTGKHNLPYLRRNMQRTLLWLGQHLLPPADPAFAPPR